MAIKYPRFTTLTPDYRIRLAISPILVTTPEIRGKLNCILDLNIIACDRYVSDSHLIKHRTVSPCYLIKVQCTSKLRVQLRFKEGDKVSSSRWYCN